MIGCPGDSLSRAGQGPPAMNAEDLQELWKNGPAQQQPPFKFGGMPGTGRFDIFTPLPSLADILGNFGIDTKRIASHQPSIGHDIEGAENIRTRWNGVKMSKRPAPGIPPNLSGDCC